MPDHASRRCSKCGEIKPLDQFHKDRTKPLGRGYSCRECANADDRRYAEANREAIRKRQRLRLAANRGRARATFRRWYQANREEQVDRSRSYRTGQRALVFGHYGTACACCGATKNLTIDHINGDGAEHRLELYGESQRHGGVEFYTWLIRQGFPMGYQTLCRGCNSSKDKGERWA